MTAAALSQLVDESSVQWDSVVSSLMPDFVLSDSWATNHITVTDALSHRTGYPSHDNTGLYGNSSERMIQNLRNLPMSYEPRVKWQYCNIMYGAMGHLVEILSNKSLAEYFKHHLWKPMGMDNTYLHPDDALARGETLCQPFYWNNDTNTYGVVEWKDEHNVAGAGMAISSVSDWAKYLRHMIDESGPISKAGHAALKEPKMLATPLPYFVGPLYYAFGWQSTVFQNENIYFHSGLVDRMMSIMVMIPSRRFGFVIMTNASRQPALDSILMEALYDHFQVPEVERIKVADTYVFRISVSHSETYQVYRWTQEVNEVAQRLAACPAKLFPHTTKVAFTTPLVLDRFIGTYHNKGYGNVSISKICDWINPKDSPAALTLTKDGCVLSIKMHNVFRRELSFKLQHMDGNDWIAWYYDDDFATVRRPAQCYRAQVLLDEEGFPSRLGLDVRMETDDTPLTWFNRLTN